MDVKAFHKRVQPMVVAMNKLLTDLETEMVEADERNRVEAERADAVAQAKRELLAEKNAQVERHVNPVTGVTK